MERTYAVYLLASKRNGTLYIGVTNDLIKRVWQHKQKEVPGFTEQYNVSQLVYYEFHRDIQEAIAREKKLKNMVRRKKIALIEEENPNWKDLYNELF